ncbi:hypothetical protein MIND_01352100 [Mycena indigotica]|uniref:F-box domain-containing protein n=1 Tax=Mycena indigotica TaxID=2126181 RepID=A0A8H6S1V7_9AGAR|nr:uncharacterized protein MIND_01352100 [Mycena indigotica]KAF7289780.1 hypothetical protein MIND_01352100 [Mycena indigotica]
MPRAASKGDEAPADAGDAPASTFTFPGDFPPELLARILAQLPYEDVLLGAQRVCKGWKRMVESDPGLQTRMFRRASGVYLDVGVDAAEIVAGSEPVVFHPLVLLVSYSLGGAGAPRPCVYLHVKPLQLFAAVPGSGGRVLAAHPTPVEAMVQGVTYVVGGFDEDEDEDDDDALVDDEAFQRLLAYNAARVRGAGDLDDDGDDDDADDDAKSNKDGEGLQLASFMDAFHGDEDENDKDEKEELAAYAAADELATIPTVYTATLIAETEDEAEVDVKVENPKGITVRDIFDALERAATREVQTVEGSMPLHDAVHGGVYEGLTQVERKGRHLKAYVVFGS